MWDNPRLLNSMAGFLTALAVLALVFAGVQALLRSTMFPLREIVVHGTLRHTVHEDVVRAARARAQGNFFAVDLAAVRAGLETLPWVRRVQVRRAWPDRLEVTLEEHAALARWGSTGLVNTHGERFAGTSDARLPLFDGPEGAAFEIARRYRRYVEVLAPLARELERVELTPRHAWSLGLSGGLELVLGRDAGTQPAEARLARFVAAWPATLGRLPARPATVDLRYPNGFALRVPGLEAEPAAPAEKEG